LTDTATTVGVVKRLTGVDLGATRAILLNECFVAGRGFWSQYAGQGTISCTTTAICVYALAATGRLTKAQKDQFRGALLAFRRTELGKDTGAFPRTTGEAPSVWTTGQAVLALWSVGCPWHVIRPSVEWLLRTGTALALTQTAAESRVGPRRRSYDCPMSSPPYRDAGRAPSS
jgi:hypothetical protein